MQIPLRLQEQHVPADALNARFADHFQERTSAASVYPFGMSVRALHLEQAHRIHPSYLAVNAIGYPVLENSEYLNGTSQKLSGFDWSA